MRNFLAEWMRKFSDFWWGDRGLSAFLFLLLATLFLGPFFESRILSYISSLFFTLLLISGVAYVSSRRLVRYVVGIVALAAIVLHWLAQNNPARGLAVADHFFSLFFLAGLTLVVLVRAFAAEGAVTADRVRGAVAAYLLFGVTFSVLYRLIEMTSPGAFNPSPAAGTVEEELAYFSFVTLTTLGYGDVTAVHPVARMFVVMEALIGQLYPATLLARLVSLELSTPRREKQLKFAPPQPNQEGP